MLGQAISQAADVFAIGLAAASGFSFLVVASLAVGFKLEHWATRFNRWLQRRREDRELVEMIDDWPAPPPFREEPVDLESAIEAMGGRYVPTGNGRVA